MFTSAIAERTVIQGKESNFSEPRDPLMQRVQPFSKRHFCLGGLQGMDVAQSHVKKKKCIGKRTEKKLIKFLFLPAPSQKYHLLNNSQPNQAARLWGQHWWVLDPPGFPTSGSPTRDICPCGPLFWSPAGLCLSWVQGGPPWRTGGPALLQELNEQHSPSTEPGSMFVNTGRLPVLECGFFGDLHLFESSPQGFPRIPFHLAEAQRSFSSFLV